VSIADPLRQRRETNIAGYIIGMWHVEDLMRAAGLDMEQVERLLLAPLPAGEARDGMRAWYAGIVASMRAQGLERSGHLEEAVELVNALEYLHRALLETVRDADYAALWAEAEPAVRAVQEHSDGEPLGPVESGLTAVYGVMVLRAEGKPVGASTADGERCIRNLLDHLSAHYRRMRRLPGVSLN
jgi:hypothetical protein